MGTVTKEFADNLVKHNGYYNGDTDNSFGDNPRCIEITEYTNQWGRKAYGLTFDDGRPNKYIDSDYVINPKQYWKYEND